LRRDIIPLSIERQQVRIVRVRLVLGTVAVAATATCSSAATRSAPIELRLSKSRRCSNGQRLFSKLHYTWTAGAPVEPAGFCPLVGVRRIREGEQCKTAKR
jgi:hypothetical protein